MPRITVGEQMVKDCLEHFRIVPLELKNFYDHIGTYVFDKIYPPLVNLRPDFVITLKVKDKEVVLFIEFDGEQHYYPVGFGGERRYKVVLEQFAKCLANDERKNEYWRENELPFLRISYQHRQKDAVMFLIKDFLMKNNCHQATPVLKGSNPESIYYHFQTSDKELQQQQQQQQLQQFETAIAEAFKVEVSNPPQLEELPKPESFFELDNWPEGYGPSERSERHNSSYLNREDSWYEKFVELAEYQEQNGNCNVPQGFPDNPSLGNWVLAQRQQYRLKKEGKHSHITAYRIRALEELGFHWNRYDGKWYEKLDELKDYKKLNGNCDVPDHYPPNPSLGKWVQTQRGQYKLLKDGKPSSLSDNRIRILEEMDFQWRIRGNPIPVRDNWRSRADSLARCKILSKLIEIAKHNEKFCTSFSNKRDFKKLMLSFEMALYYSAESLYQYSDLSTLANRIKKIIERYRKERDSITLSLDKVPSLSQREWQEEVFSLTRSRAGVLTIRLCRDLCRTGRGT